MRNVSILGLTSLLFFGFFQVSCTSMYKDKNQLGVEFVNVKDGDSIKSPFMVKFKVNGKKVMPAGKEVEGTGHHHIIIDGKPIPKGVVVPADNQHLHFGKGQAEAELKLTPGEHSLTLQFADGFHKSFGPEWSKTIKVNVKK